jgi:hypothetical protein
VIDGPDGGKRADDFVGFGEIKREAAMSTTDLGCRGLGACLVAPSDNHLLTASR